MFGGSRPCSLATHPVRKEPAYRREVQDRVKEPGPGALQMAEQRVLHGIADVPLLRHAIDQPERFCPARVDGLAGQHQGHRLHRIDETREARGATEAGMQAEHHFGKAKAGAVDRNAGLAGKRDFEAAAEAEAVNDGDGRNLQTFQAVDHRMRPADRGFDRAKISRAAKFVDIGAGDESGLLRRANDQARGPLVFQRRQHSVEFLEDVGGQRVGATAFAVEQQPGNAVGIPRQLEMAIGAVLLRLRPEFEHAVTENVHDP